MQYSVLSWGWFSTLPLALQKPGISTVPVSPRGFCQQCPILGIYAIQCPILGVVLHSSACTTKTGDKHRPYKPLWLLPGTLPFKVYMQYSVLSFSCHQNLA